MTRPLDAARQTAGRSRSWAITLLFAASSLWCAAPAVAQVTPAGGYTPPDDTPSIRLGLTVWPQYTLQTEPEITDAAGNQVHRNAFDVGRAYINITGQISHLVAFRLTPDITRESSLLSLGAGNTVANDSLVFRIKYAYGQFNLDDWTAPGTWIRLASGLSSPVVQWISRAAPGWQGATTEDTGGI